MKGSYAKFAAMVATSTIVMFVLMYTNTYRGSDVEWSETRGYMALVMGSAMALVMLLFMRKMLAHRRANIGIVAASIVVFAGGLYFMRSQTTVDDIDYMRAMIPHHSIAIMTSERAHIHDPRVRGLADRIDQAQRREILEMKGLIDDIEQHGPKQ